MTQIPWLSEHTIAFPPIEDALEDPNGLLAAGGDLSAVRLVEAYRSGIFPWFEEGQPILWWSPDPRLILRPGDVHIARSLKKVLRSGRFRVTTDQAFAAVMEECARPRSGQAGTWITDGMKMAYKALFELGYAHSVEVWEQNQLVGGLYGVAIGQAFFGESMFSRVSNASKIALVTLAQQLQRRGFGFIDCQVETDHLNSMGGKTIARREFRALLQQYTTPAAMARLPPTRWQLD